MNEPYPDEIQILWQKHGAEQQPVSEDDIRQRARDNVSALRRKIVREYIATTALVIVCAWRLMAIHDPLLRLGCWLLVAGGCTYLLRAHKRVWRSARGGEAGTTHCLDFYRRELTRRYDLVRRIAPLLPGMAVLLFSVAINAIRKPSTWFIFLPVLLFTAAGIALGIRERRKLRRELDWIDAIQRRR